ncbi:GNAT family N-acetyltransferase [Sphingomonas panacisoli]|uniref:GNAT family N-acetyltransferase n=1 Tax=Sphingomonas panacisoli TaxID=1813879 RepID=A0A5B8LH48_9SPHN|nr:GNAT family N-acetyltransferase [Sphingomonas panacisoli]QDZ07678.1 GNAT family N-acetyltransferase [Sphingomonas panacisoli]
MSHPLDRPVWGALNSGWAHVAEGDERALRVDRDHGVFGAAVDGSEASLETLASLVPDNGELWLIEPESWPAPPGTRVVRTAELVQMTCDTPSSAADSPFEIVDLTDADAPEMLALATLTRPGPYVRHTNRLGRFVGVRVNGTLVAMAGERMKLPGWSEISAVCTHPDHRGRGYAAGLMRIVAARMIARQETPWLTSYTSNAGAIALYDTLGFRRRAEMTVTVLAKDI